MSKEEFPHEKDLKDEVTPDRHQRKIQKQLRKRKLRKIQQKIMKKKSLN